MRSTLAEIAKLVEGEVVGNPRLAITGFSGIKEAGGGDLTFLANAKYSTLLQTTKAAAILVPLDVTIKDKDVIRVANPSLAFAKAVSLLAEDYTHRFQGIHEKALVAADARLGQDVSIGPYAIIESGVSIGDKSRIYGGSYIGANSRIGSGCLIYPNVTIRERTAIGQRVTIHSGTVIGADGFGYVNVEGVHEKIPQIGIVEIQDNVEIGANVTIDRARFDKTVIGEGTKIDNLVQIAHNVRIGKNCIIVSQVGISGSTVVEDNCILAGQVGIVGHITIGEGAVVTAKSGVPSSLPGHEMYWGIPAKPHREAKRVNACVQRLPHYVKIIQDLQKRIAELEAKIDKKV
jgi:UDP-3-O-[3-hydroxymyristoyl] glucosamine N-acyltransferase